MLTGRLLLMLVVMTATLAVRSPASVAGPDAQPAIAEQATWVQKLGHGVARPFSRIGLLQRVTLRVPAARSTLADGQTDRFVTPVRLDPLRTCLPPPVR